MSFNISGISSGIDTSSLVEALMAVERRTVNRLEASKTAANDEIRAWDRIVDRIDDARDAIKAIRTGRALDATTATSTNTDVVRATAQSDALPGSYAFRVNSLAAAQQVTSTGFTSGTALTGAGTAVVSVGLTQRDLTVASDTFADGTYTIELLERDGSDLTVSVNGVEQTVTISAGGQFTLDDGAGGQLTLDGGATLGAGGDLAMGTISHTRFTADGTTTINNLASALNANGGGVRAQVVDTGDGSATSYRLVLTARGTGTASAADIDLSGLAAFSGGLTTLRGASDAEISLGEGGLTITRSTNTIADAFDGITLDLVGTSPDSDVEVVVERNGDAQVAAVRDAVDAISGILSQVRTATAYNVDARTGAPLVGSSAARSIGDQITAAMGSVVTSGPFVLLSQIGISFGVDGTYTVDEVRLREALADDPDGVEQVLLGSPTVDDDGVFDIVLGVLDQVSEPSGRIQTAKEAAEATIRDLDESIAMQEARLELAEQRFLRQFTAMETALAQLNSQSAYLTSVIGSFG